MKQVFLFFACTLSLINQSFAQQTPDPIQKDFNELIEQSNDYQGYKVVNYESLVTLRDNTIDHIEDLRKEISTREHEADKQKERIKQLEDELEKTILKLQRLTAEKDNINFLGMPFSKGNYMALIWGIVALLVIALLFFIYQHKNSHAKKKEAERNLRETEKEFEAYRAKSLEKEQRLGRLLQDERNKSSNK